MKIALITANIGGIDSVGAPPKQTIPFDFYYYTENNLPMPMPNLNDRMKGRYLKVMAHQYLPDYDAYIWIDGTVQVIREHFVEDMIKAMISSGEQKYNDVFLPSHPDRNNVYAELEYIMSHIKSGNQYLSARYKNEPFDEERKFYISEGVAFDAPLYCTRFMARMNTPKINNAFDAWWAKICEYTIFEQAMFTWVEYKHKLNVIDTRYHAFVKQYLEIHKHLKSK
jgi:hypothetical protein